MSNFHNTLTFLLNKHFPEKEIKISNLDKKWITPELKSLSRKIKKEYYRNKKSPKWRKLKKEFKLKKRKRIKSFHSNFVTELKSVDPSKFYTMCKSVLLFMCRFLFL